MPFTISHAVLAPPLARLSKHKLPIAALAVGCMAPDLIRFFVQNNNNASHQWSAIIQPNLWVGLFFTVLWYAFYRPMLYRVFALNDPIRLPTWRKKVFFMLMMVLAIMLGTVTHLLWDGFTHADARTLLFYDELSKKINILGHFISVHMLLQLLSSAIPLPILAYMVWSYAKKHHVHRMSIHIVAIALIVVLMCALGFIEVWLQGANTLNWPRLKIDPYHTIGDALVSFFKGALLGLTMSSVLYMLHKKTKQLMGGK